MADQQFQLTVVADEVQRRQQLVVGRQLDQQALETMHRHKTGALIEASVQLGALASGNADEPALRSLQHYAQAIGLAFQVQDDILDVESDTATLGKTQGKDEANHKPTYPALLGMEAAKAYALELRDQALHALRPFGASAEPLRELARWLYRRLEDEYACLTSDDAVDEAIAANEYTFTESGHRFG